MSIIITPFNESDFAREMKPKISGVDLVLSYENIESSLAKVSVDCKHIIGSDLYDAICQNSASTKEKLQEQAKDFLQRSMLHFCMYEHLIFTIVRIKNDGVTIVKGENETTIYKSQQNELEFKLISLGWFWMNQLIKLLNDHAGDFPLWNDSNPQKELNDIPISLSDFTKWVGISDEYFFIVIRWLIREVWTDCVLSRVKEPERGDQLIRAVCYEVVGRACLSLSYHLLPEPIRKNVNDELGKNHAAQEDTTIREKVSKRFLDKARSYWIDLEAKLTKEKIESNKASYQSEYKSQVKESDSFCY